MVSIWCTRAAEPSRICSMTLLWLLLLFFVPQTSAERAASDQFVQVSNQAAKAREEERLEDAERLYREAVRLRPDWKEGWWYLGTMFTTRTGTKKPAWLGASLRFSIRKRALPGRSWGCASMKPRHTTRR